MRRPLLEWKKVASRYRLCVSWVCTGSEAALHRSAVRRDDLMVMIVDE